MDKAQIILFFITGFFVSRLVIKTKLPEWLVSLFFNRHNISLMLVVLNILLISVMLSFFIPNVITVLTLLPVINMISETYERDGGLPEGLVSTILALSLIYGANIGGMSSVTASAANGILVSFLGLQGIEDFGLVTFSTWLGWGIPLVIVLTATAWVVLTLSFRLWRLRDMKNTINFEKESNHPFFRHGVVLSSLFFISSFLLSVWMLNMEHNELPALIVSAVITAAFAVVFFLVPFRIDEETKAPLLTIPDCYSNLPMKGFLFVGFSLVLGAVVYIFNLQDVFALWFKDILPTGIPLLLFFFVMALLTSFATELGSNTAVQISLFIIVIPLAEVLRFSAAEAMILVTLSSTCAFMSPIATGVNGLAFGGVKRVSFWTMLLIGFGMNVAGALVISLWIRYVLPFFA